MGEGGAPRIRVFDGADNHERLTFDAFEQSVTGGVTVAAGDLDGDGRSEVIAGSGPGGRPRVGVFEGTTGAFRSGFLAFDSTFRGGCWVAAGDLDGDGKSEIVVGAGPGSGPHLKVFDDRQEIRSFFAFDPGFRGGVRVAVADLDGDGRPELIAGAGPSAGPHVKAFDSRGAEQRSFYAFDPAMRGGVFVSSASLPPSSGITADPRVLTFVPWVAQTSDPLESRLP
jgi:hypothetical protein